MGLFFDRECNHKWASFPMQIAINLDQENGFIRAEIKKSYVCRLCKERKEVELLTEIYYKREDQFFGDFAEKVSKELDEKYPCPPYKEVEEAINDFIYIDKEPEIANECN